MSSKKKMKRNHSGNKPKVSFARRSGISAAGIVLCDRAVEALALEEDAQGLAQGFAGNVLCRCGVSGAFPILFYYFFSFRSSTSSGKMGH